MLIENKQCFCQSLDCKYFEDNICLKVNLPIKGTALCEDFTEKDEDMTED